jgi:uncharacterized protein (PEP-CTERM system associated)
MTTYKNVPGSEAGKGEAGKARRRIGRLSRRGLPAACSVTAALLAVPCHAQAVPWEAAPQPALDGPYTGTAPSFPARGGGAPWDLAPRLTLSETYTDNVTLARPGAEKSDFVTQVRPGISLRRQTARFRLRADYSLQGLVYARESSRDQANHHLKADATAELVDDLFYTDVRANVFQQNISLLGPLAPDNLSVTGNRTDVRTFLVSPYIRRNLGTAAGYEVRYTRNAVYYSTSGASDSQADRLDLRLASGPDFGRLGWNASFRKERVDYDKRIQDVEIERTAVNLNYRLTPRVSLLAGGGYEKNNYLFVGDKPEGGFWHLGARWTPTTRTDLSATVGRRFFGNTASLNLSHRTRRTVWRATYSDDIITTRGNFFVPSVVDTAAYLDTLFAGAIADPVARASFVESFLDQTGIPRTLLDAENFITSQVFRQKRLNAAFGVNGVKNTVFVNLFHQAREAQATGTVASDLFGINDFASNKNIRQTGAALTWAWRFAPRTSANLNASYTRSRFVETGREDDQSIIRAGLTRRLTPKTTASLIFRHLQRDSTDAAAEYRENAVTVALHMTF